jgi:cytochrome P450
LETYELLNAEREASRFHYGRTDHHEYLMLTRYDDVWAGLQDHNRFSNSQESALAEDLSGVFVPQSTDPPRHGHIRRLLNPYFSPKAVARLEDLARGRVAEMIAEVAPEGSTNMAVGFAIRYPTEIFLKVFGAPLADGDKLLPWTKRFVTTSPRRSTNAAQNLATPTQI